MQASEFERSISKCLMYTVPNRNAAIMQGDLYTIRNLREVVIYIWLTSGKEFWYHVKYCSASLLLGYIKDGDHWSYMPIKIDQVDAYY